MSVPLEDYQEMRDALRAECLKLAAEIERLFLENGNLANTLGADNLKMREVLEWLDRRGGLGYDAHDRIKAVLGKTE